MKHRATIQQLKETADINGQTTDVDRLTLQGQSIELGRRGKGLGCHTKGTQIFHSEGVKKRRVVPKIKMKVEDKTSTTEFQSPSQV